MATTSACLMRSPREALLEEEPLLKPMAGHFACCIAAGRPTMPELEFCVLREKLAGGAKEALSSLQRSMPGTTRLKLICAWEVPPKY